MKWCVAVLALGLTVLAISETASAKDYAKDYSKYYEKYVKKDEEKKEGEAKPGAEKDYAKDYSKYYEKYWKKDEEKKEGDKEEPKEGTDYAKDYAKEYEHYWKKDDGSKKDEKEGDGIKDYAKEYEHYWKKDWAKEYGNNDPEEANDYLDDTYLALKSNARSLNLDPIHLPDSAFKLRVSSKDGRVIIQVKTTQQVLTGFSTVKRVGEGSVQKYYGDPKLGSVFKARDLEINGELYLLGGTYNKTCTLFVDIEELTGRVELGLPENKTEPLSVASLRVFSPGRATVELEKGCVEDERIREELLSKYQEELREDLGNHIRRPLKDALTKSLKPFGDKQ